MGTKIRFSMLSAILGITSLIFITNCTKDDDVTKDATLPELTTTEVIEVTQTTAKSGGVITFNGGATVTERGVCWSTSQTPTIADNKTSDGTGADWFTSVISGLTANTTYYVRAYATNSAGTGYGSAMSFTTLEVGSGAIVFNPNITYGSMTDIDGNTYKTVTIGTQTWMAENLRTTKYNDNTSIPLETNNSAWTSLSTPAYCWYNNDAATYKNTYGALYNWYAVSATTNGGKNVCPSGWHVPTDAEWTTLTTYLGGENVAGGKLKETGTTHWNYPNTGANNSSGFTAVPGGYRIYYNGSFNRLGYTGFWWSSSESTSLAWSRYMDYDYGNVTRSNSGKRDGFSVRCVRD